MPQVVCRSRSSDKVSMQVAQTTLNGGEEGTGSASIGASPYDLPEELLSVRCPSDRRIFLNADVASFV